MYSSTSSDLVKLIYNDENPNGNTSFNHAHSKGVIVMGKSVGFWLVHSVPKYPSLLAAKRYGYPHTGQMYGQSFLCISLATSASAESIGRLLQTNWPFINDMSLPKWAEKRYDIDYNVA